MSKISTNEELIIDLINFSPYGALSQVFIIDAIRKLCNHVIENEQKLLIEDQQNNKTSFISIPAWIGTAKDIKARMDDFYNVKS